MCPRPLIGRGAPRITPAQRREPQDRGIEVGFGLAQLEPRVMMGDSAIALREILGGRCVYSVLSF